MAAFVYMAHGTQKLFGFPAPFPMPHLPPMFLAGGLIETFGGLLLLLGLFTRPVAFILSGEMAVAYFKFHAPQGFWPLLNDGEGAALQLHFSISREHRGEGRGALIAGCGSGPQRSSRFLPLRLEAPINTSELSVITGPSPESHL
jgi:putative oxidoreductase